MKLFFARISFYTVSLVPLLAAAQIQEKNLRGVIKFFTDLIDPIIGLVTGIAVLLFIWGIVKYIIAQGSETAKASAKNTMFYGVIALFVLFSFWGIVQLLRRSIFGA
jgi:hypothetical protein